MFLFSCVSSCCVVSINDTYLDAANIFLLEAAVNDLNKPVPSFYFSNPSYVLSFCSIYKC